MIKGKQHVSGDFSNIAQYEDEEEYQQGKNGTASNLLNMIAPSNLDFMHRGYLGVLTEQLNNILFPGIPPHYPLRKKILITRGSTAGGAWWDLLQISFSVITCVLYVWGSFPIDKATTDLFFDLDVLMVQFFAADFLLNFYLDGTLSYFTDPVTLVDMVSIVPTYVYMLQPSLHASTNLLQCFRILRLVRIFKGFKLMRNVTGVRRQVINLSVTLTSAMFLAAGVVQIMENISYAVECKYINAATGWEPSCTVDAVATEHCECSFHSCRGIYLPGDVEGQQTGLRCTKLTFFDSFYFVVVTLSTVGYGHIVPSTIFSKMFILIFVVACLVIIPMSVSRLQTLLGLQSPFRRPYQGNEGDEHIVVCGHVNDANKLTRFFREFFHEDRLTEVEFHAVILSPTEPNEEVRALLSGSVLGSRVTYVIGTAMATEDLKRARADTARCMFFLCNTEVTKGTETNEDAATILRALSVSNFNSHLECLVQVLRPEERVILKDSDVDCILCLDEFKTVLQARNSVCPGFSTFIENIFHSVEDVPEDDPLQKSMAPWYNEYLHGAGMELYFVDLSFAFLRHSQFKFSMIAQIVYDLFDCVSLGMCNKAKDSVVFNPRLKDLNNFANMKDFYRTYNVLVIMADDQYQADSIGKKVNDTKAMAKWTLAQQKKHGNSWNHLSASMGLRSDGEDDSDDSDEEEANYIGFSSYRHRMEKERDRKETEGLGPEVNSMKGPHIGLVPKATSKGLIKQKKTRLVPTIQGSDVSERRVATHFVPKMGVMGQPSATLKDANHLRNHVVVFGCDTYLPMFIAELRRPAVTGESYHPIVIIAEDEPEGWDHVLEKYNDLYYVKAAMTKETVSTLANVELAFSLIFLAPREQYTHDDENKDSVDAVSLFAFLKLEQLIPTSVFCSIELNSSGNMAVLNATIMKRARRMDLDDKRTLLNKKRQAAKAEKFCVARTKKVQSINRRGSTVNSRRTFSTGSNGDFGTDMLEAEEKRLILASVDASAEEKVLWETIDTHHIFPVYASARVFVPSSFETLLVQSFFVKLTPVICERLICGQLSQTVMQVSLPEGMEEKKFIHIFRAFSCCNVICLGLYRAPREDMGALLPYVFNAPPKDTVMHKGDKVFLFGSTKSVEQALAGINKSTAGKR